MTSVRAEGSELLGDRQADARAAAGDDGDLSLERVLRQHVGLTLAPRLPPVHARAPRCYYRAMRGMDPTARRVSLVPAPLRAADCWLWRSLLRPPPPAAAGASTASSSVRPRVRRRAASAASGAIRLGPARAAHARRLRVRGAASRSPQARAVLLRLRAQRARQQRGLLRRAAERQRQPRVEPSRDGLRDLHRRGA